MLISFMNNDDWVYYRMVQNFLHGNFALDPISAPTFYTQGILGFMFAKLFGINNLPILTILISFLCVVIFYLILRKYLKLPLIHGVMVSLFLLFNPFFIYSSIGFMTENYFLFFVLLSLLLFYKFENNKSLLNGVYLFSALFLAFLLRQVAMVFPISLFIYYLLKKEYKLSLYSLVSFVLLYSFYSFIFPQTAEMHEKPLQFQHLFQFDYSYALVYGSLLIITALLLPLIISFILFSQSKNMNIPKFVLLTILSVALFIVLNKLYKPMTLSWGEFPYLENIWERTGFYPRGIVGTKYQFRYNYDLYYYWDIFSKFVLSILVSFIVVVFPKKKLIDFNIIFVILYMGIMLLTETFYDRYLLILVPFIILFLVKNISFATGLRNLIKINHLLNFGFIMFLSFYTYQLMADFILVNNYVWNKSVDLVNTQNIAPAGIHGNNAWKLNYPNPLRSYPYKFSYDSPQVNEGYRTGYDLVEVKTIKYPLNIFINPNIYLYKKK